MLSQTSALRNSTIAGELPQAGISSEELISTAGDYLPLDAVHLPDQLCLKLIGTRTSTLSKLLNLPPLRHNLNDTQEIKQWYRNNLQKSLFNYRKHLQERLKRPMSKSKKEDDLFNEVRQAFMLLEQVQSEKARK